MHRALPQPIYVLFSIHPGFKCTKELYIVQDAFFFGSWTPAHHMTTRWPTGSDGPHTFISRLHTRLKNTEDVFMLLLPPSFFLPNIYLSWKVDTNGSRRERRNNNSNVVNAPASVYGLPSPHRAGGSFCMGGTRNPGKMDSSWVGCSSRYGLARVSRPWWSYPVAKGAALGFVL